MSTSLKFPLYAKFTLVLIGVFVFIYTLYIGKQIILPIIYATITAIILNPLVNYLVKKRMNRIVAISLAVVLAILFTMALLLFVSAQITMFTETYPALEKKFNEKSLQVTQWASTNFSLKVKDIDQWVATTKQDAIAKMGSTIGQTLWAINNVLILILLLPVYLFMILYYKNLLIEFIRKLFNNTHHTAVFDVLSNSKKIIQSYLFALVLEACIVAVLNSAGLLLLGVKYAIILGITGALLNIIPYIGGVIAIILPMIIAFVTKDNSTSAILVLILYLFIQFIDNNIIIPHIVASKVKINALISLIAVIVAGALWGVPGMFLSIPITAILKVIFDHVEPLKPWGYLLGNIVPTTKLQFAIRKRKAEKE